MLPDNKLSLYPVEAPFMAGTVATNPFSKIDYELGAAALNSPVGGLYYQLWTATINEYNRVVLTSENDQYEILIEVPEKVKKLTFAFDQNMRHVIAYEKDDTTYLYWYDTISAEYVTSTFPNVISPALGLDERRQDYILKSDVVFAYVFNNNLCCRLQRDRYQVEYILQEAFNGYVIAIGTSDQYRLQMSVMYNTYGGVAPAPSMTPMPTVTATVSLTPTPTVTASVTPTPTVTATVTPSPTITLTPTITITPSITVTATVTPTMTPPPSPTLTPTVTPTPTLTPSVTPSPTPASALLMHWNDNSSTISADISLDGPKRVAVVNSVELYDGSYHYVHSDRELIGGKSYWEITLSILSTGTYGDRVGLGVTMTGFGTDDGSIYIGSASGAGLWDNGKISANGSVVRSTTPLPTNTPITISFAYDSATKKMWISNHTGAWIGGGDPATGTSPSVTLPVGDAWIAANIQESNQAISLNTGQEPFVRAIPSGFANP